MPNQTHPDGVDVTLEALGSARRRYVLYYTRERGEVSIDDLAAAIVHRSSARPGVLPAGSDDHERVRTALHHRDLPKLSEAGLVSVDRDAETVAAEGSTLGDALVDLLSEHELAPRTARPADLLYRGV